MANSYATISQVSVLWRPLNVGEEDKVEALLKSVSSVLRNEARKVGKDLDEMVEADDDYAEVVAAVTIDIVARVMRQSTTGEVMSQESQSALGYTWSGTYAVPGGGIANAVMRNDLKRLGLRRQRIGVIEFYDQGNDG